MTAINLLQVYDVGAIQNRKVNRLVSRLDEIGQEWRSRLADIALSRRKLTKLKQAHTKCKPGPTPLNKFLLHQLAKQSMGSRFGQASAPM